MTTVERFVETWAKSQLREQQGAQDHFIQLCRLVGHPSPAEHDPEGKSFTFEEHVTRAGGGRGRADVWLKDHFAWEYKGRHRDLDAAYQQVLSYRGDLDNPPLLVVCDFDEYRIYPQWPNVSGQPIIFHNADLAKPNGLDPIRWLLTDPPAFLRQLDAQKAERARLTEIQATRFATLADLMRTYGASAGWQPMQIARFLTKLVFCLFVEDIGLLPTVTGDQSVFSYLVQQGTDNRAEFKPYLENLFKAMDGKTQSFMMKPIHYFNGGLFAESAAGARDGYEVLDIATPKDLPSAMQILRDAAEADWSQINPTIFGTLFERALDPNKRAQLGAHYTSEADIRLIVEPVLMQPLYDEWAQIRAEAEPILQTYIDPNASQSDRVADRDTLSALRERILKRLGEVKVLDPACGSGNFLYVSLRALKDLEQRVHDLFKPLHLPFRDVVTPRQLYGIEKDEFAAKLAQIAVWIGYLQWRYEHAGASLVVVKDAQEPNDPRELTIPIVKDKDARDGSQRIVCADAILRYDDAGKPYEPTWPTVDVIIGNPPFLGGSLLRGELGGKYLEDLWSLYGERIPGASDLVCYWFEKARGKIESQTAKRAGLIATNSIRGGANRTVLDRIKQTGDIFMAWPDQPWVLNGAAVRTSLVGFDDGSQNSRLMGRIQDESVKPYVYLSWNVTKVNSDLTSAQDLTFAKRIASNRQLSFIGPQKDGPLDIDNALALQMLASENPDKSSNHDVLKRYVNGEDITDRSRKKWIIDFDGRSEDEASQYKLPFEYIESTVKPLRDNNNDVQRRLRWWLLGRSGNDYRDATKNLQRQIMTPRVSKHRVFTWVNMDHFPDSAVVAIARSDDYFFGALHSYAHEIWSLRMGTWLGKGNDPRYTPTTTFETFPFPFPPNAEPVGDPRIAAIAAAASALHAERDAWLNPVGLGEAVLRARTLTKLYNAIYAYRVHLAAPKGQSAYLPSDDNDPKKIAPRMVELHAALDRAVLQAYGWADLADQLRTEAGDEELLRRLLALNLARG